MPTSPSAFERKRSLLKSVAIALVASAVLVLVLPLPLPWSLRAVVAGTDLLAAIVVGVLLRQSSRR
jgi:hypothetical protein